MERERKREREREKERKKERERETESEREREYLLCDLQVFVSAPGRSRGRGGGKGDGREVGTSRESERGMREREEVLGYSRLSRRLIWVNGFPASPLTHGAEFSPTSQRRGAVRRSEEE